MLSSLTARVDALSQSYSQINLTPSGSDIPGGPGAGWFGADPAGSLIWIVKPLERATQDDTPAMNGSGLLRKPANPRAGCWTQPGSKQNNIAKQINKPSNPSYTPRNATLIGSTAMTALVGGFPCRAGTPHAIQVITGAITGRQRADDTRVQGMV